MKKKECAKNLTFDTPSWGALGTKKRGAPTRSPCYCKDTKKVACLQMQGEKGGQK